MGKLYSFYALSSDAWRVLFQVSKNNPSVSSNLTSLCIKLFSVIYKAQYQ